jgi:hypothetical protein
VGERAGAVDVAPVDRDDAAELVDATIDPRRGADVRGEQLGFVEELGRDVDEALIDAEDDDVDQQGDPRRRARGQLGDC